MGWSEDLIVLAQWALQQEDLRHRFLRAPDAASILSTGGVDGALETGVVLRIYEAAVAKGYRHAETIEYEKAYTPGAGKNGQRVDLAFKEAGRGKNWAFVEVKYYGSGGVQGDIYKLLDFPKRIQRWMLVYRVVPTKTVGARGAPVQPLSTLMGKYGTWGQVQQASFATVCGSGDGECQIYLGRLL